MKSSIDFWSCCVSFFGLMQSVVLETTLSAWFPILEYSVEWITYVIGESIVAADYGSFIDTKKIVN